MTRIDRVVPPLDRVRVFEPSLDVRLDAPVVFGRDMQRLAVGFLADIALFDQMRPDLITKRGSSNMVSLLASGV